MNARPQAWFQQATDDLAVARLTRDNGFFAQACYHSSQAAEKALKGLLLELGQEPPRTHVLSQLLEALANQGLNVDALKALPLNNLSRIRATSRYPLDATPPSALFDQGDADQAIATATSVLELVQELDQPRS